ncbi:MAG: hypothetical protein ACJAUO_002523, partial [Sediminicola sp.]
SYSPDYDENQSRIERQGIVIMGPFISIPNDDSYAAIKDKEYRKT